MIRYMKNPWIPSFAIVLMFFLSARPSHAEMVFSLPAQESEAGLLRKQEMEKVRQAMENRIVRQKLAENGLKPEDVEKKMSQMSDRQIHLLARASDRLAAGGDVIGLAIGVLIIVLLIVLILKLLGKDVSVK